jgi:F0F1-type ATP synthase delta subunit
MKFRLMSWILSTIMAGLINVQAVGQVAASTESNTTISNGRSTYRYSTSGGVNDFNIEMRGKIELTADDKDIKGMSDDGYLEINKTVFGSRRTIIIESLGEGKLKREYYEGRTKMDWEPNGKAWLNEILPDIVRNTTIGAESRVDRIFKKGGTAGVLEEIGKIDSEHAKSHYANLLMKQPVQAKDYANIVNSLAKGLDSDHYLSEFLKNNVDKLMQNKEAATAFFNALSSLDSDHYKTVVVKEALQDQIASADNVKIILQSASKMESDHYITEVLTTLLKQNNLSEPIIAEMITTTNSIESDHYKTIVLTKALDKPSLTATSHQKVIESVKDIESDHYVTEVIKHLLQNKLSDEALTLVLDLSGSMESAHYKSQVLGSLINRQDLKDEQFNKLVDACGRMDSDHYKTTVFKQMLNLPNLSETKLLAVINGTKRISSDHYLSDVLISAAAKVKSGSATLKDAYRQAAKGIESETYYGRALRAIE